MKPEEVTIKLAEKNTDTLFNNLSEIYATGKYHHRVNFVLPYHECVLSVFQEIVKENQKNYHYIRWLLSRLLEYSQREYVWDKASFKKNKILEDYSLPENFLLQLWIIIKNNDANGHLIDWLDNYYQLTTQSIQICLKRYAFSYAFNIAKQKKSRLYLMKIIFSLPLIVGIAVGWIFLLQAGDAVKYFTMMQFLEYNNLLEIIAISVPLLLSGIYFYNHAYMKNIGCITLFTIGVWGISLLMGIVFMSIGYQWFIIQNKEWLKEWTPGLAMSVSVWNAIIFVLIWSSMAVFIGIFAQIIWSGRGPTEISE